MEIRNELKFLKINALLSGSVALPKGKLAVSALNQAKKSLVIRLFHYSTLKKTSLPLKKRLIFLALLKKEFLSNRLKNLRRLQVRLSQGSRRLYAQFTLLKFRITILTALLSILLYFLNSSFVLLTIAFLGIGNSILLFSFILSCILYITSYLLVNFAYFSANLLNSLQANKALLISYLVEKVKGKVLVLVYKGVSIFIIMPVFLFFGIELSFCGIDDDDFELETLHVFDSIEFQRDPEEMDEIEIDTPEALREGTISRIPNAAAKKKKPVPQHSLEDCALDGDTASTSRAPHSQGPLSDNSPLVPDEFQGFADLKDFSDLDPNCEMDWASLNQGPFSPEDSLRGFPLYHQDQHGNRVPLFQDDSPLPSLRSLDDFPGPASSTRLPNPVDPSSSSAGPFPECMLQPDKVISIGSYVNNRRLLDPCELIRQRNSAASEYANPINDSTLCRVHAYSAELVYRLVKINTTLEKEQGNIFKPWQWNEASGANKNSLLYWSFYKRVKHTLKEPGYEKSTWFYSFFHKMYAAKKRQTPEFTIPYLEQILKDLGPNASLSRKNLAIRQFLDLVDTIGSEKGDLGVRGKTKNFVNMHNNHIEKLWKHCFLDPTLTCRRQRYKWDYTLKEKPENFDSDKTAPYGRLYDLAQEIITQSYPNVKPEQLCKVMYPYMVNLLLEGFSFKRTEPWHSCLLSPSSTSYFHWNWWVLFSGNQKTSTWRPPGTKPRS